MDFRNTKYARGIRNNNPGNLRKSVADWLGKVPHSESEDKSFEQFISIQYGLRALMKNVITWVNKRGENTVRKLITKWAPPHENKTQTYIQKVSNDLGISPDAVLSLNKEQLIALAKTITEMENGNDSKVIPQNAYNEAFNLIGVYEIKKKSWQ